MSVPPSNSYSNPNSSYPAPERKPSKLPLILGLGCGVPILLIGGCIAVTANKVANDPEVKKAMAQMNTNVAKDKVTYDPATFKMKKNGPATVITGVITNKTDETVPYLHVKFALLDESGNKVGAAIANTSNIAPKAQWTFQAPVSEEKATKFKLTSVSTAPMDLAKEE